MKLAITSTLLLALPALAVNTSRWTHTNEADFKKGTFKNVVATNLGDLKLSRAVKMILEQDAKISAVYSLAEDRDGTIYAGTGPHGIVLRIKGETVEKIYEADDTANVLSMLLTPRGELLLGIGSEEGKVLRLAKPGEKDAKPKELFTEKGIQYVWAIQETKDGQLYLATGPKGQIFEVKADGTKSVLLDSDENNILSLISDGKDVLYAGTDPNGLVYRINRKSREVFVLFDAPESEVSALALDAKGNLYAGTAEASEKQPAAPGQLEGSREKSGRPEGTGGVPIPSQPPENPKPPVLPDPNPGEPDPIPKVNLLIDGWQKLINLQEEPGDGPPGGKPPGPGRQPTPAKPGAVNAESPAGPVVNTPEPIDFGKPKPEGNAIYKIDSDGFVREIFRQPAMVLSIAERQGVLLVGTGSDGLVYQLDPAAEETVVLAKVDPKQIMTMLLAKDGRIVLGMANVGGIASMSSGFASEGTYTSPVLDAAQISRFGKMHLQGSLPRDAGLTISTRSGNVQEPEKTGWSNWSEPMAATSFLQVASPSARFMQYRLNFTSKTGSESAVVDEVDVAYQMPNLAPAIKSIKAGSGEGKLGTALAAGLEAFGGAAANPTPKTAARSTVENITWEAEDGNGDALVFSLHFRNGPKAPWILLKDKLTENTFAWDTRTVADGRYEIKVTASDGAANVAGQGRTGSRVSDPIRVDNTPPAVGNIKTQIKGTSAQVQATIVDRTATVASVEYSVDSNADWQAVLPSDNIFDGPEETVDFTIAKLTPGAHQITLRAADAKGNHAYETVFVNIEAQAGK